jgi:hypothetical protein
VDDDDLGSVVGLDETVTHNRIIPLHSADRHLLLREEIARATQASPRFDFGVVGCHRLSAAMLDELIPN